MVQEKKTSDSGLNLKFTSHTPNRTGQTRCDFAHSQLVRNSMLFVISSDDLVAMSLSNLRIARRRSNAVAWRE
jgi:hypothetical protein